MKYAIDFWLTTYCQARCRSCARTNQETGEEESWLVKEHMKLDTFTSRLDDFDEKLEYIQFCGYPVNGSTAIWISSKEIYPCTSQ